MNPNKIDSLIRRYEDIFVFANRKIHVLFAEQLSDDITAEQFFTLRLIKERGPCTSSLLSEWNCVNRSATTAMVDRLVAKGYVTRQPDSQDRRVILLQATEEAEQVLQAGQEKLRQFVRTYLDELEEGELESFISVYERIWNIIQEKEGK